jgi:hypothetical protein
MPRTALDMQGLHGRKTCLWILLFAACRYQIDVFYQWRSARLTPEARILACVEHDVAT